MEKVSIKRKIQLNLVRVAILLGLAGIINLAIMFIIIPSELNIIFDFYLYLINENRTTWTSVSFFGMMGLISTSTAGAYVLYYWSRGIGVNSTSAVILQCIEPLSATAIYIVIFREFPSIIQVLGLFLLIAAIISFTEMTFRKGKLVGFIEE